MQTNRVVFWVFSCLALVSCNSRQPGPQSQTSDSASSQSAPLMEEFELTTSDGVSINSRDLNGKVWVASYFFTQCGSNCRMLNMTVAKLAEEYGPLGVHFVSLTCDPMNDTPAALAGYAKLFNADKRFWTFTTGELDYLQQIGSDMFEVSVSERSHHARITILDQQGMVRGTFDVLEQNELKRATNLLQELLAVESETAKPSKASANG